MSAADVKTVNDKKATVKKTSAAEKAALKLALDAAGMEFVPLSDLVKSPLNARSLPYPVESVRGLANTIEAIGLLHNLVVHTLPDGKSGVAAGGRRLTAMQLLCSEQRLSEDHPVAVKRVSEELALIATVAENEQRVAMHPAEQIHGFSKLAAQGNTASQIGAELGFSARHVQRMLKLTNLAPSLLTLLAEDKLNVEQCQALCLEDDQVRQVEVFESVCASWSHAPAHALKTRIIDTEISLTSPLFEFVGREDYEVAGGVVREDLFSQQEGEGTAERALTERLALENLSNAAREIEQREGWAWSMGRLLEVSHYGEDGKFYVIADEPESVYTKEESARLDELQDKYNEINEPGPELDAVEAEINAIEQAAGARAWTDEMKINASVVVSLHYGEITIQRGVRRKADLTETPETEMSGSIFGHRDPDVAEGVSLPQLTKMSSERTLAVQAALMQQPEKAVALMVWRLCSQVFSRSWGIQHPFSINITVSHSSLTADAPTGKDGAAFIALMQERARLEALLPEGWEQDFTTFFALEGGVLMSLMAYCTACSVNGVQTRECQRTSTSKLNTLETAIGFHLRDWWHPTRKNFFADMKHAQIVAVLKDAGLTGAASDAEKMKKGDAADLAEAHFQNTRWVPDWMKAPEQKTTVLADITPDTDGPAHAA
ncbi:ParB/RepB/Spo0J family partition protein [Candidatus Pantoea floridensis]|uniref:Uncharacterized protein YubM n=1 Tax=Candidatus Pantoea floridensis TaxID=1938870 RepID=A0A286DR76_9GAMM|nr:ParB/RepB/Spo0J family partition protein [Pantoea floridensis]PIF07528.1 ParB family chromosome partitioning protein [Enterobacteriaceae bacterium JKS000233]SOD61170.1 chromosome partitioning protein, ParB family [Pantoea floridensis]